MDDLDLPGAIAAGQVCVDDEERRGVAMDSLVTGGCLISGATVRRSVLFSNVHIHSFATVEDAVILPDVDIGRHANLRRCVIDKGCKIPEHLVVGLDCKEDERRFYGTGNSITLITPDMLGKTYTGYIDAATCATAAFHCATALFQALRECSLGRGFSWFLGRTSTLGFQVSSRAYRCVDRRGRGIPGGGY